MKLRDMVLLLVGGGLVVFGILVGDLLENDAFADGHESEIIEYEYAAVYGLQSGNSHQFRYLIDWHPDTPLWKWGKEVEHDRDFGAYPYNYVHIMNEYYAPQGWVLDRVDYRIPDVPMLLLKRIKQ